MWKHRPSLRVTFCAPHSEFRTQMREINHLRLPASANPEGIESLSPMVGPIPRGPTLGTLAVDRLTHPALVDRDDEGEKTAKKFEREFAMSPARIIRPRSAITIEDLFDATDFQLLLNQMDKNLKMEPGETPSKAVKRLGVDKILLSRKFAEKPSLYSKSQVAFAKLLSEIESSFVGS